MTPGDFCQDIVQDLERLSREAQTLADLSQMTRFTVRAAQALERFKDDGQTTDRPMHVALVGATGVGKSELFNALIGQPQASPVSPDIRCCTERPVAAVAPGDKSKVNWLDELGAGYVSAPLCEGFTLIDTPDLNGAKPGHHEAALRVVQRADLVVLVTIPDSRADFDVLDDLDRWKDRQHWLFVMNKLDRETGAGEKLRADFDRRLAQLGFEPNDRNRYLVSAVRPDEFDMPRLRNVIFSSRPRSLLRLSRFDTALGHAQHALEESQLAELASLARRLDERLGLFRQRLGDLYLHELERADIQSQLLQLVRVQSWQHAAGRVGWPMAFALHVRNRLALLAAGYHMTRLLFGSVGLFRLGRLAFSSLLAASRGLLPMLSIAEALGDRLRRPLADIRGDVDRTLEDFGLVGLAPVAASELETSAARQPVPPGGDDRAIVPHSAAGAIVDEVGRRLGNSVRTAIADRTPAAEIMAPLSKAVERAGLASARAALGPLSAIVCNIPPVAVGGHAVYRLVDAWVRAEYLPGGFYLQGLTILAASFIPGFLWISLALRWRGRPPESTSLLDIAEDHPATEPLRAVRDRIQRFTDEAMRLRRRVMQTRRTLGDELPPAFGTSALPAER